ncbi:MAG: tape measure protein [Mangrovibacterium sp.]
MENIDGGLAFKSALDNIDFLKSADVLDQRIRKSSDMARSETFKMDNAFRSFSLNASSYISNMLVGGGMTILARSIIRTRGDFQQLEIAFNTMLGSQSKAKAMMDQMVKTAATTPFDLKGVAGGAKQLLAYGFAADKVNDTLIRLGNVAAGLSIPLGDMVYLYGTTMAQGRMYAQDLNQFTGRGIPMIRELAKQFKVNESEVKGLVEAGKVGFPQVQRVIQDLTNQGGMFFNLMSEQSKSLTGLVSNLGDAWDKALNDIGKQNQGVLADGIKGAISLVENYDDVLRILKAIAIAYGTYKAAIVFTSLATKGQTSISIIDNTVRQAKIALLNAEAVALGQTTAIKAKMAVAEQANTAALSAQLTIEEQSIIMNRVRVAAIQSLLTAEQQRYLQNLNISASNQAYVATAIGVLTVEQKEALSKMNLTSQSEVYVAEMAREVAAKTASKAATLDAMRTDVKAAAVKVSAAKSSAVASMQATEMARYELYWAKQSGNATAIAAAEKKLAGAVDNQTIVRKAALAAQSEFYTKKKQLETFATRSGIVVGTADVVTKGAQATATSFLSVVTSRLTLSMKALWASMMTNPIGWVIGIMGALLTVFTLFGKKKEEQIEIDKEFEAQVQKEINSVSNLMAVIRSANEGTKVRKDAIQKLNSILEQYNIELLKESSTVEEATKKYDELSKAIKASTSERLKAQGVEKINTGKQESDNKALENLKKSLGNIRESRAVNVGVAGTSIQSIIPSWVQGINDEMLEFMSSYVSESTNKLKDLTGVEYLKAYADIRTNTVKMLQVATGASDTEMQQATRYVTEFVDSYVKSAKEAADKTNDVTIQMDRLGSVVASKPKTEGIDYLNMTFTDLIKKQIEVNKQIDEINKNKLSPDTDLKKLEELKAQLGLINTAMTAQVTNTDTESGIQAKIDQLKKLKADAKIGSLDYETYKRQIEDLENKMPKTDKKETADAKEKAKQQKELADKEKEAALKLEESRVEIMEEGYDKRTAMANLQHKRTIATIDKEQRDMEAAYKEAGKKMPKEEVASFDERRSNADKDLAKTTTTLFDGELDYKKKKYELYFKWVKEMGVETANEQFKDLLQGGSSFFDYVKKQKEALSEKLKSEGGLSEGDSNKLISLSVQYNELTGAKSAMDLFKESLSVAIEKAGSLGEKLEAIAKAKEKLQSGNSGIISDDQKLEASNFVTEQEKATEKEIQDKILNDLKSFEQRREDIRKEYASLRMSNTVQGNNDLLDRINKGEADAISQLNAAELMDSKAWKNLFSDLDSLTASQIEKLLKDIQNKLSSSDLKLNPVDYKAVIDSLNEAKTKFAKLNPFKSLVNSIGSYSKALKDLKKAQKEGMSDEEITKYKQGVKSASKDIINTINEITDISSQVGGSLSSMMDSFGNEGAAEGIGTAVELMGSLGQTAGGVAKIMAGDIVGGIADVVTGLAKTVTIFNQLHDKKNEKRIQALQERIEALAKAYDTLSDSIERAYSTDKAQMIEEQNKNLQSQNALLKKQIEEEKAKKKTDDEKIKDWQEQIEENNKTIAENSKYKIIEAIMGTDIQAAIDNFANAYADAWASGENAASKSTSVVKNLIKTAIIDMLKSKLKPEVEAFMKYMSDALSDGLISDAEESMIEKYKKTLDDISDSYLSQTSKWLTDDEEDDEDPLTGSVRGMSEETGSVVAGRMNAMVINQAEDIKLTRESLSYQSEIAQNTRQIGEVKDSVLATGSVIVERMNSMSLNHTESVKLMRESLLYQSEIAQNTRPIGEIRDTLKSMNSKMNNNSLLSQGIGG